MPRDREHDTTETAEAREYTLLEHIADAIHDELYLHIYANDIARKDVSRTAIHVENMVLAYFRDNPEHLLRLLGGKPVRHRFPLNDLDMDYEDQVALGEQWMELLEDTGAIDPFVYLGDDALLVEWVDAGEGEQ